MPPGRRRPLLVALFAAAVLLVSAWVDLARAGRTDLIRDPLSTLIVLVFGAIAGDVALSALDALRARRSWPRAGMVAMCAVIGALAVWIGSALTPLMAMVVQIPRAGLEILPTILLGLEYVLRQSIVPAAVVGIAVGLVACLSLPNTRAAHP